MIISSRKSNFYKLDHFWRLISKDSNFRRISTGMVFIRFQKFCTNSIRHCVFKIRAKKRNWTFYLGWKIKSSYVHYAHDDVLILSFCACSRSTLVMIPPHVSQLFRLRRMIPINTSLRTLLVEVTVISVFCKWYIENIEYTDDIERNRNYRINRRYRGTYFRGIENSFRWKISRKYLNFEYTEITWYRIHIKITWVLNTELSMWKK